MQKAPRPLPSFPGFISPQYTQVPDALFDELMSFLSGAELKVLLYIIRRTFGFKKDSDSISLNQICNGITTRGGEILDKGTGLSQQAVITALKGLVAKNAIVATRRTSKEKGHEPTTYSLNLRPFSNNQTTPSPKNGEALPQKLETQQTVTHSTDLQLRNSKAKRQEETSKGTSLVPATPVSLSTAEQGSMQQLRKEQTEAKQSRTGSLRTLSEILTTHQPSVKPPMPSEKAPKLVPTEQLLFAVTEISGDFNDLRNLKSNTSQALHIWQASGRSETAIIASLYEARSITRQQRDVRYPIRYFWKTVRDLMGLSPVSASAAPAPIAGTAAG